LCYIGLFNPYRVVNLYIDFTTGFGLRPTPAVIIVMTPLGSGKEKLRECLQNMFIGRLYRNSISAIIFIV